jgi:hypothetical protein
VPTGLGLSAFKRGDEATYLSFHRGDFGLVGDKRGKASEKDLFT